MKSPSGLWDSNLNPQVWFLGFLYLYFTLFANTTYKKQKTNKPKKITFSCFQRMHTSKTCAYVFICLIFSQFTTFNVSVERTTYNATVVPSYSNQVLIRAVSHTH